MSNEFDREAFFKEWAEALRSGKYKQAQSQLYSPSIDGYCCLGVACELLKEKGLLSKVDSTTYADLEKKSASSIAIPRGAAKLLNISLDGHFRPGEVGLDNMAGIRSECLSGLNDIGWTFEEIAKIVDKPEVFLSYDEHFQESKTHSFILS